jgi:hypothetical protein
MKIPRATILISSFLIILLWAGIVDEGLFAQSDRTKADIGTNYALIIGIRDYVDKKWPDLEYAVHDAKAIYSILTDKYDFETKNVTLLTSDSPDNDKKPNLTNILTKLKYYKDNLTEKDNLFIFYSGHSEEDDKGETYWIQADADENLNQLWLKHSELCNDFFESEEFKAKSVAIITDSVFQNKLLGRNPPPPSPSDLRYTETISAKALKPSREVIAFGDKGFGTTKKTGKLGFFTYYIHKALDDNWFRVIDLENLFLSKEFKQDARKTAGTRLVTGRLRKSAKDMKGQVVLSCLKPPPPINITNTYIIPEKGQAGDTFTFYAETNRPAFQVYIEIEGRKYRMSGEGTNWHLERSIKSVGDLEFQALAINEENKEGNRKPGKLTALEPEEGVVVVTDATVSPDVGEAGGSYTFTAKTDIPAKKVTLIIAGRHYPMKGSGTDWSLTRKIEDYGNVPYYVVGVNEKDIGGRQKRGSPLTIKVPKINIVESKPSPQKGYAGEEYTITAKTNFPAQTVELTLGGKTYPMEGDKLGKKWQFKREIPEIGKLAYSIAAKNTEGIAGRPGSGEITTEERPPGIPDIASVNPKKAFAGVDFDITARTSEIAQEVTLELAGKTIAMEGSGTNWKYKTRIASIGKTDYRIIAKNKDGIQGKQKRGTIEITEKEGVEIAKAPEISPKEINPGKTFTVRITTKEPAKKVQFEIDGKGYPMSGLGQNWSLTSKIEKLGPHDYNITAFDNKDKSGTPYSGTLLVSALVADVTQVSAESETKKNFAGEEFTFTAKTNNPAQSVTLNMNNLEYPMELSGNNWTLKKPINEIGKWKYTVIAKNKEGKEGKSKSGTLEARYAVISAKSVSDTIYAKEDFIIDAKTNDSSTKEVYLVDGEKRQAMEGSGTDWSITTKVASIGSIKLRVIAIDKNGKESVPAVIDIKAARKPVNVAKHEAPSDGYMGQSFKFTADTDGTARRVELRVANKSYEMTGSGTKWTLSQRIEKAGSVSYEIVAYNEDNVGGLGKTGTIKIKAERYKDNKDGTITDMASGEKIKRFKDNNDDTVTDLLTGMMWAQAMPKRNPMPYEEAEEYVRSLDYGGHSDWRLPTRSELDHLMDKTQSAPALPPGNPFKIQGNEVFWSKDKKGARVYAANIYMGKTNLQGKTNLYNVLPVRRLD